MKDGEAKATFEPLDPFEEEKETLHVYVKMSRRLLGGLQI